MLGIRRREFITLLGAAAAWPLAARGQQGDSMRRIGVLTGGDEKRSRAKDLRFRVHASACGLGVDGWPQRADRPSLGRR